MPSTTLLALCDVTSIETLSPDHATYSSFVITQSSHFRSLWLVAGIERRDGVHWFYVTLIAHTTHWDELMIDSTLLRLTLPYIHELEAEFRKSTAQQQLLNKLAHHQIGRRDAATEG